MKPTLLCLSGRGSSSLLTWTLFALLFAFLTTGAAAFGAGHLTEGAHLDGRAFRHGDFSEALVDCAKVIAGSALALQIAATAETEQSKKTKKVKDTAKKPIQAVRKRLHKRKDGQMQNVYFDETDVARVYFGNWCRDMSQVLDIGLLKSLGPGFLTNVVAVLGFMSFSRGTREFEVTEERLGCYRHEEHIDNPWGYPDDEGSDPRELSGYSGLRGPVRKIEVEVDPRTGMKNYIANEDGDWDTSTAYLKKCAVKCIELGRSGLLHSKKHEDWWEALRLLGQVMHVMEDFPAHSNWTELCLNKLGHTDVFCYVGKNHRVEAPNTGEQVPPLVTGTFGGADAVHSILGEGVDKICEMGTSELSEALLESKQSHSPSAVKKIFSSLLSSGQPTQDQNQQEGENQDEDSSSLIDKLSSMRNLSHSEGENFHKFLTGVFAIHDQLARRLSGSATFKNDDGVLKTFILATVEPVTAPILSSLAQAMADANKAVVDEAAFSSALKDPDLENPSHSVLASDHLTNLLNGPNGELAIILTKAAAERISQAWNDLDSDPQEAAEDIAKMLHHPWWADPQNKTHTAMRNYVEKWLEEQEEEREEVLERLTLTAILEHRNTINGLKNASTINRPGPKSEKIQIARRGLWGLIADGMKKLFCCKSASDAADDEEPLSGKSAT